MPCTRQGSVTLIQRLLWKLLCVNSLPQEGYGHLWREWMYELNVLKLEEAFPSRMGQNMVERVMKISGSHKCISCLMWVELCPPHSQINWHLTPSTCNMTYERERDTETERTYIQHHMKTHTEGRWSCDDRGRDCFWQPENIRACQHTPEVKRDMRQILLLPPRRNQPGRHLDFRLQASKFWENKSVLFKQPSWW